MFVQGDVLGLDSHVAADAQEGKSVQAHVRFRATNDAQYPRLPEGSLIKIVINIPGITYAKQISAFSISSVYGQPRGQVLLLVVGGGLKIFKEKGLLTDGATTNWINCTVKVPNDQPNIKRQISALQELHSSQSAKKYLPVFLNQKPDNLLVTKPLAGVDSKTLKDKMKAILDIKSLNEYQRADFDQLFAMHGGFTSTQGFSGSGETIMIAIKVMFLLSIGMDVLLCASTHAATNNLLQTTVDLLKLSHDPDLEKIKPVRVNMPIHERQKNDKQDAAAVVQEQVASDIEAEVAAVEAENAVDDILTRIEENRWKKNFSYAEHSLRARIKEARSLRRS